MDRRTFVSILAAAGAASPIFQNAANAQPVPKVRNLVLVHGLFADGSCWSEVIPRLQAAGINATAVQNPLTTLEESVAAAQRALALQDGSTVLVGHSFSGSLFFCGTITSPTGQLREIGIEAQRIAKAVNGKSRSSLGSQGRPSDARVPDRG